MMIVLLYDVIYGRIKGKRPTNSINIYIYIVNTCTNFCYSNTFFSFLLQLWALNIVLIILVPMWTPFRKPSIFQWHKTTNLKSFSWSRTLVLFLPTFLTVCAAKRILFLCLCFRRQWPAVGMRIPFEINTWVWGPASWIPCCSAKYFVHLQQ